MNVELTIWESNFRNYMDKVFYSNNDDAHRIDHVDGVWDNIVKLINRDKVNVYNRNIVFLAVYLHDMYCWKDRATHNKLVLDVLVDEGFVNDSMLCVLAELNCAEMDIVKDMVYWHRSSLDFSAYKPAQQYIRPYVEVMRWADKGAPVFKDWLERSLKYHHGEENAVGNVKKHFIEKFGKDGYAWKNDPGYATAYADEYDVFQEDMEEWLERN